MGRPKGSKNKVTFTIDEEQIIGNAGDGCGTRIINRDELKPIYIPPEKIETEVEDRIDPRGTFCKCGHSQAWHYDGARGHCNHMGCHCETHEPND